MSRFGQVALDIEARTDTGVCLLGTKVMHIFVTGTCVSRYFSGNCIASVRMRAKDASLVLQCEYVHRANVGRHPFARLRAACMGV